MQRLLHPLLARPAHRAAFTGALLGALVWAMARHRPDDHFALAMACVLLLFGAASFVCHALALEPRSRRSVPAWIVCLGSGVLASLAGLNLL
ncbi:MAG TPA: hypothetical protein VFR90_03970 [Methylibium sp.]|uniref:hypothetical protein n=1 Tax=Methylibium sp. TaxID=2067992 RepID=UPI002DBA1FB7|nr:hypothetical protein [Methylibium sp.]HEU4458256.1 hypothetical protein [Methylibium sp.]